jgi:N-acetylmuramoyl-L-alanine amidase
MKIALIVGHTNDDPGACSPHLETCEYPYNKQLADRVGERLSCDFEARVFLRSGGIGLVGVAHEVNDWGAALCLSLHFNAATNPRADGTEMLYWHTSSAGRKAANALLGRVAEALGTARRGLLPIDPVDRDGVWDDRGQVLSMTTMPHVLCEPFFGSHEGDCGRAKELGAGGLAEAYAHAAETVAPHL